MLLIKSKSCMPLLLPLPNTKHTLYGSHMLYLHVRSIVATLLGISILKLKDGETTDILQTLTRFCDRAQEDGIFQYLIS